MKVWIIKYPIKSLTLQINLFLHAPTSETDFRTDPMNLFNHYKLAFLNNSISGIIWSYSASADWQLIWHWTSSPLGDVLHVTKTQVYFIYFYIPLFYFWHSWASLHTIFHMHYHHSILTQTVMQYLGSQRNLPRQQHLVWKRRKEC